MVDNLKIGDHVITASGIVGLIRNINKKDKQIEVEIANGVSVTMLQSCVSDLIKKDKDKDKDREIKTKKIHPKS